MRCEDCKCADICYKYRDICAGRKTYNEYFDEDVTCSDFIDRTRFVELPCKVGDTVYQTDGVRIYEFKIKSIIYDSGFIAFNDRAIGKNVFLSREEAEKALSVFEDKKRTAYLKNKLYGEWQ